MLRAQGGEQGQAAETLLCYLISKFPERKDVLVHGLSSRL